MGSTKVHRIYMGCAAANAYFFLSGGYGLATNGAGGNDKVQDTIEQMPQ
jgi:hypothetical protein